MLFPFPTFFPLLVLWPLWTLTSGPGAPFSLSLLLQPFFFRPSSAPLPGTKAGQAYQGEMGRLDRGTEVRSALTRGSVSLPSPTGGLNLGEGGEDVLSEKHWIGLMPGSVVTFTLIKGETKEGDNLPHTSSPPAELFNRCIPPSRSGLSSGKPCKLFCSGLCTYRPIYQEQTFLGVFQKYF